MRRPFRLAWPADPTAAKQAYGMEHNDDMFDAFLEGLKTQVLGDKLQGTPEALLALGQTVLGTQGTMNAKLFDRVETVLRERVESSTRSLEIESVVGAGVSSFSAATCSIRSTWSLRVASARRNATSRP
ncbi:MAG: hypothetical protein V9G29_01590 [Burkholderiaceae bacterium]